MKQIPPIISVILCGGSGTRLWPLSRKSFPKQFVPLIENKSLLQLTLERVARLGASNAITNTKPAKTAPLENIVCVASEDHRFFVKEAMREAGVQGRIILEPAARNTAAAMALAALGTQPADLLLFCPADHHIPDTEAFAYTVEQGRAAALAGAIVTFGVKPSFPSSAYGYIQQGAAIGNGTYKVDRFIEKPSAENAQHLLLQGNVLWNAGIFLTKAQTLLDALNKHAPDILQACRLAMASTTEDAAFIRPNADAFVACRSESIDYAVMEHETDVVVVPLNCAWSDVGSWDAISDLTDADDDGNRIDGQGLALESEQTYIHAPNRLVVTLGTKDLLVIDTPDALLVAARSHCERVKEVVAALKRRRDPEAVTHRKVARPWGWYDCIDVGDRFQVKHIVVKPGAALSLQKHHHRAEHWIVVKGTAEVTRGEETFLLTENQSSYISIGEVHRLVNPGKIPLEMIEVQTGGYLEEDDIVRLEDTYGRM